MFYFLFIFNIILVTTKEIDESIFSFSIKYPDDIETKEYHIGDDISLLCTLHNTLPIDFDIQTIELEFTTEDGEKSFVLRNEEGSLIKAIANGTNNEFVVRNVTEFHGVYKLSSVSFVVGNLKLVYNSQVSKPNSPEIKFITVVPVLPTTEIIAKFPSK